MGKAPRGNTKKKAIKNIHLSASEPETSNESLLIYIRDVGQEQNIFIDV